MEIYQKCKYKRNKMFRKTKKKTRNKYMYVTNYCECNTIFFRNIHCIAFDKIFYRFISIFPEKKNTKCLYYR